MEEGDNSLCRISHLSGGPLIWQRPGESNGGAGSEVVAGVVSFGSPFHYCEDSNQVVYYSLTSLVHEWISNTIGWSSVAASETIEGNEGRGESGSTVTQIEGQRDKEGNTGKWDEEGSGKREEKRASHSKKADVLGQIDKRFQKYVRQVKSISTSPSPTEVPTMAPTVPWLSLVADTSGGNVDDESSSRDMLYAVPTPRPRKQEVIQGKL